MNGRNSAIATRIFVIKRTNVFLYFLIFRTLFVVQGFVIKNIKKTKKKELYLKKNIKTLPSLILETLKFVLFRNIYFIKFNALIYYLLKYFHYFYIHNVKIYVLRK